MRLARTKALIALGIGNRGGAGSGGGGGGGSTPNLGSAALSHTSGSFAGGRVVTVTGASGIDRGATVTIDGQDIGVYVIDAVDGVGGTSFRFTTPRVAVSSAGAKSLTVTNPNGLSATKSSAFTYNADSIVPQFSSMTALAAAVTTIDARGELINATSGELIARFIRNSAGANGLKPESDLFLYRAAGSEFDGAFAPVLLGTGSIVWGTPGSTSTGGVSISGGIGTIKFPGMSYIDGQRRILYAQVYIGTFPANNAGDCLLVGCIPTASTISDLYAGGVSNNGSGVRAGGSVNGNPTTPGLGYGPALGGAPTAGQIFELFMTCCRSSNAADSANFSGCFHPLASGGGYAGTEYNLANTASLDGSLQTFVPCLVQSGMTDARFIKIGESMARHV